MVSVKGTVLHPLLPVLHIIRHHGADNIPLRDLIILHYLQQGGSKGATVIQAVNSCELIVEGSCSVVLFIPHTVLIKSGAFLHMPPDITLQSIIMFISCGLYHSVKGHAQRVIPLSVKRSLIDRAKIQIWPIHPPEFLSQIGFKGLFKGKHPGNLLLGRAYPVKRTCINPGLGLSHT